MTTWCVLLAAGSGSRLAAASGGTKKQFLELDGAPLFWRSAVSLARIPRLAGIVFVFPQAEYLAAQETVIDLDGELGLPWLCAVGGARRQDSVASGLAMLPPDCDAVLVHDAARPFASPALVNTLLDELAEGRSAVPALPVTDTIKTVAKDDLVGQTLTRANLRAVQTPQAFPRDVLTRAHAYAAESNLAVTDDASMVEALGEPVRLVPGEPGNVKITSPEDLALLTPGSKATAPDPFAGRLPVTGFGYDVHRYVLPESPKARPLKLGAVLIPTSKDAPVHVQAHSDGDVLLHALADALLGILGTGDIGDRFPDTDPALENMESALFINEILEDLHAASISLIHVDLTLIAQIPRIAPHKDQIRAAVANLLRLTEDRVVVKATTEETLGFTGRKEGIKAVAVVSALK